MSTKTPPPVAYTVTIPADLANFFEQVCARHDQKPADILVRAIKSEIASHLTNISSSQKPWCQALSSLYGDIKPENRARLFGRDKWPWTDKGKPANLEEAEAAALQRGKDEYIEDEQLNLAVQAKAPIIFTRKCKACGKSSHQSGGRPEACFHCGAELPDKTTIRSAKHHPGLLRVARKKVAS